MKELYNTNLALERLTKEQYDMLMDFLEDNNMNYEETDFEEYYLDERTEDEKYEDWLSEQTDLHNDEVRMGLVE